MKFPRDAGSTSAAHHTQKDNEAAEEQKNKKKKGKVSLRGDSSQAVEAGACMYNGAAFTVQGGVPC